MSGHANDIELTQYGRQCLRRFDCSRTENVFERYTRATSSLFMDSRSLFRIKYSSLIDYAIKPRRMGVGVANVWAKKQNMIENTRDQRKKHAHQPQDMQITFWIKLFSFLSQAVIRSSKMCENIILIKIFDSKILSLPFLESFHFDVFKKYLKYYFSFFSF